MKRNFLLQYGFFSIVILQPAMVYALPLKPDNSDRLFQQQTQQQQAQQQQFEAKAPDISLSAPIIKSQLQFEALITKKGKLLLIN
ncbi:hypothetical protein [Providencia stuartii]|nr:hypothetical protein [Providencia stuartii]